MTVYRKNITILFLCQILFMSIASMMITIGGLVGHSLAANKALATLPVSAPVVGTALMAIPASMLMRHISRRAGFMLGTLVAMGGGALSAFAVWKGDFWLLCAGTLLSGMFTAFAQLYRFAAAEAAPVAFRAKAISLVLLGGVVASYTGPQLAKWSRGLFVETPYLGSYLTVIALGIGSLLLLSLLTVPPPSLEILEGKQRPLWVIVRQPTFITAALGGMIGYAVMALLMTGTPLAMVGMGHPFGDAAFVIQWHLVGMFLPSLFTGHLIARFGAYRIMATGAVLLLACIAIGLSGNGLVEFVAALALLGVGWNFLFIGGSALLSSAHTPAERAKTQATNDFLIFGTVALASLSSGQLLHYLGWRVVLMVGLAPSTLVLGLTGWMVLREVWIKPAPLAGD